MSAAPKRRLGIAMGFLAIPFLLVMDMVGMGGSGDTLGSTLAERVNLRSLIYYEVGFYEGALYVREDAQTFRKVFSVNPIIPPLIHAATAMAILLVYFLTVFQIHKSLAIATGGAHPIKPGKAVWGHLVPIYSFYWVFGWTNRVAEFVTLRNDKSRMWKGLTGLSLLIGFVLVGADVVIGTTITLLTLAYIRGRVSAVLESPALA